MTNTIQPPEPRPGLAGEWDRFVGPGQTRAELWLILIPSLLAGVGLPWIALARGVQWSILQVIVAGILALDLTGGVVTNATAAAKRWYHRPGQGPRQHLGFIAVHVVHLALLAGLFGGPDWGYLFVYATALVGASLLIVSTPQYLQRPAALLLYLVIVLANLYLWPSPAGLEWFVPVFFLKLLVSYLVAKR